MDILHELEPGEALPFFPVPKDFSGVHPTGWGCLTTSREGSPGSQGLLYILGGSGRLREGSGEIPYQPGQTFVLTSSRILVPAEETRCLYLLLQGADSLLEQNARSHWEERAIGLELARMYQGALKGLPQDVYTASAQCYALLMELCRLESREQSVYSELVQSALKVIEEEYAYLSGMDELAQRLEVSKSHLVRCFSAETGRGPGRYLQQIRLEAARQLLISRDYEVELIAGMTGYSCSNYFCKVFRKELGISPGAYRARYHQSNPSLLQEQRLRDIEQLLLL